MYYILEKFKVFKSDKNKKTNYHTYRVIYHIEYRHFHIIQLNIITEYGIIKLFHNYSNIIETIIKIPVF